jgi:hypothetical protein
MPQSDCHRVEWSTSGESEESVHLCAYGWQLPYALGQWFAYQDSEYFEVLQGFDTYVIRILLCIENHTVGGIFFHSSCNSIK